MDGMDGIVFLSFSTRVTPTSVGFLEKVACEMIHLGGGNAYAEWMENDKVFCSVVVNLNSSFRVHPFGSLSGILFSGTIKKEEEINKICFLLLL